MAHPYKATRKPVDIRALRATFTATITGAQAADLVVPITGSKQFTYVGVVTDDEIDISRFYQAFAIQPTTTNGISAQVQIRLAGGDEWVVPPTPYTSDEEGTASPGLLAPGDLFFMRLPLPGVMVRLLVTQPVALTDFSILVAMTENSERPLR